MFIWADHLLRGYIQHCLEQEPVLSWESSVNLGQHASVEEALRACQNRLIQIQGESGSGKSTFLQAVFWTALNQADLPCIPVWYEPQQPGRFFENFCLKLKEKPEYCDLTGSALEEIIEMSAVPLLIFAEEGALNVSEINRLRAQGHSLILTGVNPNIQADEIWKMGDISLTTALQFLQKLGHWNDNWEKALHDLQQGPFKAFELSGLQSVLSEKAPTFPAEWQVAKEGKLGAYREYLKALKAYLQKYTPGFHANAFDEGFVPVNVRTQVEVLREDETEENPKATDEKEMTWQTAVPDELIEKLRAEGSGRLVITGGAGSGKSTLLRHLCLEMAQNHAHVWPLYLRLYDIQASGIGKQDLQHLLADHAELTQLQRVYQAYRGEESEVLTFLFLDGWDEVSQARDDMALWLKNRLNRYPVVLASREQSLEMQSNSEELYWTLDFDANAQEHLIERFPGLKPEEKEAIIKKISHASGIFGNPLFICLFAQTYQGNESLELTTKTKLMDYFCKALISEWNKHRNLAYTEIFGELLSLTERTKSNIQVKKVQEELFELLAYLAFRIHCSGVELTPTHLVQWLETFPHSSANVLVEKLREEKEYLKDWLKQISSVSGLIQEIPILPDTYRFLHQSFQEYLCSYFIHRHFSPAQRDWFIRDKTVKKGPEGWEYLPAQPEDWPWSCLVNTEGHYPVMELHDPQWREVNIYLMALDNPPSADDLSQGLCWRILQGTLSDKDSEANQILAAWGVVERPVDQVLRDSVLALARQELRSKSYQERRASVTLLAILTDLDYLPQIMEVLRDYTGSVRQAAFEAIKGLGKVAIPELLKALKDKNDNRMIRHFAAELLGHLNADTDECIKSLRYVLEDRFVKVRKAAVVALGRIGTKKAENVLIGSLQNLFSDVREASARALGEIKAESAVGALIVALRDESSSVRAAAAEALGELKAESAIDALNNALLDEFSSVRISVVWALRKIRSDSAINALIKALGDNDSKVRIVTAEALGELKAESAIDALNNALLDEFSSVRMSVVGALRKIRSDSAINALIKALGDNDSKVRIVTAEALGELKAEAAIGTLINTLKDIDPEVRAASAMALYGIGIVKDPIVMPLVRSGGEITEEVIIAWSKLKEDDRVIPIFTSLLKDEDRGVRIASVEALVEIGEPATDPLIKALRNEYSEIRAAAARALGKLKAEAAIEPLIQALGNYDSDIQTASAEALVEIGEPAIESLIKALGVEDRRVKVASARGLGKLKAEAAIGTLINTLKDIDPEVRAASAMALYGIGIVKDPIVMPLVRSGGEITEEVIIAWSKLKEDDRVIPIFTSLLKDEDRGVRIASVEALVEIGEPATDPLIKALRNEYSEIRAAAARALGKLKAEVAIGPLIQALGNYDSDVQTASVRALVEIGEPAIESLIKVLRNEYSVIRAAAARALGKLKAEAAIEPLIQALGNYDSDIQTASAEALVEIGEPAIESLIKALGNYDSDVQTASAEALVEIGEPAIESLIKALGVEDRRVKVASARGLGKLKAEAAIGTLINTLKDIDPEVRAASAMALYGIGIVKDPIVMPLVRSGGEITEEVIIAWSKLKEDDRVIPIFTSLLKDEDRGVRIASVEALVEIRETAIPALIVALSNESSSVRAAAAEALGEIKAESAVGALIVALRDESSSVRAAAAEALGEIKAESAVGALIVALRDESSDVRKASAEALGEIKAESAVGALIVALRDESSDLRKASARTLFKIGIVEDVVVQPLVRSDGEITEEVIAFWGELKEDSRVIPILTSLLNDRNSDIRSASAIALGELKAESAIPTLIKVLSDEDYGVRQAAASALGELKAESAIPSLIKALTDEYSNGEEDLVEILEKIGEQAIEQLISALRDKFSWVRKCAARALGEIKAESAVGALIVALRDESSSVRAAAAEALGELKAELAVGALIVALRDESSSVRAAAAEALGELKAELAVGALIVALRDESSSVRAAAAEALGELKAESAVGALIVALRDESSSVRAAAAEALGEFNTESAIDALGKILQNEQFNVVEAAAKALVRLKVEQPIDELIWVLRHYSLRNENRGVREASARLLGELKAESAVSALIKALGDRDSYVRSASARALGKIKAESAVGALIKALGDENSDVRYASKKSLGEIKVDSAVGALIAALMDGSSSVRAAAANLLGELKAESAIQPLIKALGDNDSEVRIVAAEALGELKAESAIPALINTMGDEDSNVRLASAKALGNIKAEIAIEPLIAALQDEDRYVRRISAWVLGELKAESAINALIATFRDEDRWVREASVEALVEIGEPAINALIIVLRDKNLRVRAASVKALVDIGKPAEDALLKALSDVDWKVREAAENAIKKIKKQSGQV